MSITLNLRYQKKDKWGSEIFIASPKYPEEEKAFETLRTLASKIEDMNLGTFSRISQRCPRLLYDPFQILQGHEVRRTQSLHSQFCY